MKLEELSREERQAHLNLRALACKNKDFKELNRLTKMYELSEEVARGILITYGQSRIEEKKRAGYKFPADF